MKKNCPCGQVNKQRADCHLYRRSVLGQGAGAVLSPPRMCDVLLESRRNGGGRTVTIWRGGRRRGVGAVVAAVEGAAAAGAGAWGWGRDESPIYGEVGGGIGRCGRSDTTVPVSVHGGAAAGS